MRRILRDGTAAAAALEPAALTRAHDLLAEAVADELLPGAVLFVARRGQIALHVAVGRTSRGPEARRLRRDDLFLVASLTKPLVCLVALRLAEQGQLRLDDPAQRYLPAVADPRIRLRHLLTHSSGLPDMLPDDQALRARHAPLAEFVAGACAQVPAFAPGTDVSYQSSGILLLSAICEAVTGEATPRLLSRELFDPLGLRESTLGLPADRTRLVPVELPPKQRGTTWHWNTDYWRGLGAPWGGLHAPAAELGVVLQLLLNGGTYGEARVLAPPTAAAAIEEQTAWLPELPEAVRRRQRWGFGWQLATSGGSWPDLVSRRAFGHPGATGTIGWADPASETVCVLLTGQPGREADRVRSLVGTVIAAGVR